MKYKIILVEFFFTALVSYAVYHNNHANIGSIVFMAPCIFVLIALFTLIFSPGK